MSYNDHKDNEPPTFMEEAITYILAMLMVAIIIGGLCGMYLMIKGLFQ